MMSFGQFLMDNGVLTRAQLDDAIQSQAPFGETSAAALTSLCGGVARCYERLILAQKRRFR